MTSRREWKRRAKQAERELASKKEATITLNVRVNGHFKKAYTLTAYKLSYNDGIHPPVSAEGDRATFTLDIPVVVS